MQIGVLKEENDPRVAFIPATLKTLKENHEIIIEKGAGESAFYTDKDFEAEGAKIEDKNSLLKKVDMVISIDPPTDEELSQLKENAAVISSFKPFFDASVPEQLSKHQISVFSLDMMPRITLAQDKDVLSSMASLAGYRAIIEAASALPRYFPMLTTAAGSIPPSKVLVLGAGVAGLQAIATAKRMGAQVEAFDTRQAAKEEVESLGAKFVEVEGARDDKAAGGYAVEQTEEFKKKQKDLIHEHVKKSDAVITTAQIRGKKAPILITKEMVEDMRPGSVIVDIAASTGGNCELTEDNKTIRHNQVTIIGDSKLEAKVPMHASQLYGKNILNFLKVLLPDGNLNLDFENKIIDSTCIAHQGKDRFNQKED